MKAYQRGSGEVLAQFDSVEIEVLGGAVEQLVQACDDPRLGAPVGGHGDADSIVAEAAQILADDREPPPAADVSDPALRRLFPDACPDDAGVSADFRRLTLADQRWAKVLAARSVEADIDKRGADGVVHIGGEHVTDWLTTLTAVRLMLAARLGIVEEADEDACEAAGEDDPAHWTYSVYLWMGWLEESILDCLTDADLVA